MHRYLIIHTYSTALESILIFHRTQCFICHTLLITLLTRALIELWRQSSPTKLSSHMPNYLPFTVESFLMPTLKSELLQEVAANRQVSPCFHWLEFNVSSVLIEIHSATLKPPLQVMSDQCASSFICPHGTQSLFCHPNYCSAEL